VIRLGLLLLLCLAPLASGQPPETKQRTTYPAFRDAEVYVIHDYFRPGSGHTAPAATKAPRIGKELPAELEKKIEDFPEALSKRLPPAPAGYRRVLCGRVALILQDNTNLVVDMLALLRQR
jgi:hypothetical protein